MKAIRKITFWGFVLSMCSCNPAGTMEERHVDVAKQVSFTLIPMECEDAQSRISMDASANYSWEKNDIVGIFPTKGGQVDFSIPEEQAGKPTIKFDGGGWSLKSGQFYYAYAPFNFYNRNKQSIPFSYLGQEQDGSVEDRRKHLSNYLFFASIPTKKEDEALTLQFGHVGAVLNVSLTLPVATTYASMTIFTTNGAKVLPVKKEFNLETTLINNTNVSIDETVTEYSDRLTLNLKNVTTLEPNEVVDLCMAFPSFSAEGVYLGVVVYDVFGFKYSANLLRVDNGTHAEAKFSKNRYQRRKASPVLNENFNFGVSNWGTGSNTQGDV